MLLHTALATHLARAVMHPFAAILLLAIVAATSQTGSVAAKGQFRARLSPVPIDLTMQNVEIIQDRTVPLGNCRVATAVPAH